VSHKKNDSITNPSNASPPTTRDNKEKLVAPIDKNLKEKVDLKKTNPKTPTKIKS